MNKTGLNLDREFVLAFYALCTQAPDGHHFFDSPYYGIGSHRNGLSHAVDLGLLDPAFLNDTKRTIVYTSHYHPHVNESLAEFNSKYLGGTAHELGHALGLQHDSGSALDSQAGASLMGNGNLTYRQDLWGTGPPAYLSCATVLQLLSHPLFTGSDRGRWDDPLGRFVALNVSTSEDQLNIDGTAVGAVPAYAMIAYVWPTRSSSDHGARTAPALLRNGRFAITIGKLQPDNYNLRLACLHTNGAATSQMLHFDINAEDVAAATVAAERIEQAERAVMLREPNAIKILNDKTFAVSSSENRRKLKVLKEVLKPIPPRNLASVRDDSAVLSDMRWLDAKVGWGNVARNYYWFDDKIHNGVFLMLGGKFYEKGLYAHSPSRYEFDLNRRWKTFHAGFGLRDGARAQGSAIFIVRGDGRELYRSPVMRKDQKETVKIDISGMKQLELLTQGGEGANFNSWAIWVDPIVRR